MSIKLSPEKKIRVSKNWEIVLRHGSKSEDNLYVLKENVNITRSRTLTGDKNANFFLTHCTGGQVVNFVLKF